jgi:hypothetical protein
MPVTTFTNASFQAQAGKVPAGSGKITFPNTFDAPPILVLTAELRTGGTESAKVSITSVDTKQATFVVESPNKVENIYWIASTVTG